MTTRPQGDDVNLLRCFNELLKKLRAAPQPKQVGTSDERQHVVRACSTVLAHFAKRGDLLRLDLLLEDLRGVGLGFTVCACALCMCIVCMSVFKFFCGASSDSTFLLTVATRTLPHPRSLAHVQAALASSSVIAFAKTGQVDQMMMWYRQLAKRESKQDRAHIHEIVIGTVRLKIRELEQEQRDGQEQGQEQPGSEQGGLTFPTADRDSLRRYRELLDELSAPPA